MTRVSIITPSFNPTQEKWEVSATSINMQTTKNFEWILVNDGSDESSFPHDFDIKLDRNYGPSVARNVGFQISSGDIITYLDLGDELAPNRVENLIYLFDNYKLEFLFSAYNIFQRGETYLVDHTRLFKMLHPSEYLRRIQKVNLSIPLGTAHTRKPFVECGGFQRGIVCGEDGILWRRMIDRIEPTSILFSSEVAGTYYVNETGQSRTQRRFEMGGFAFDGSRNDNGKYLDKEWFDHYWSNGLYDE